MNSGDRAEWEGTLGVIFAYLAIIGAIVLFWVAIAYPDLIDRIGRFLGL